MSAECKSLSDLRELNESELFLRVNFAYSVSLSMKKSIIWIKQGKPCRNHTCSTQVLCKKTKDRWDIFKFSFKK